MSPHIDNYYHEMQLSFKLISNTPFAHLFVLMFNGQYNASTLTNIMG